MASYPICLPPALPACVTHLKNLQWPCMVHWAKYESVGMEKKGPVSLDSCHVVIPTCAHAELPYDSLNIPLFGSSQVLLISLEQSRNFPNAPHPTHTPQSCPTGHPADPSLGVYLKPAQCLSPSFPCTLQALSPERFHTVCNGRKLQ